MKTRDSTYQTDGTHAALYRTQTGLKWLRCPSQAVSFPSSRSPFPFCPQTHQDVCSMSSSYVDIPCSFVPVMATSLKREIKGTGECIVAELLKESCFPSFYPTYLVVWGILVTLGGTFL